MNDMYKRIEHLCKEKGVNMTAMCREAGIPRSNLSDLKYGRTAALATVNLNRVANYFDVSMDFLLGTAEQTKKPTDQKVSGLTDAGYELLTPEHRQMIDSMIAALLKSQSGE